MVPAMYTLIWELYSGGGGGGGGGGDGYASAVVQKVFKMSAHQHTNTHARPARDQPKKDNISK